jgi:hypothetical protein
MADRLLDRKKHPVWNGERTKMVIAFPTNQARLDEYAEFRAQALYEDRGLKSVNAFWRKYRAELEAGAVVAWPDRKLQGEISGVQSAVNLMLRDRAAFFAEYQNDPLEEKPIEDAALSVDQITGKLSGVERGRLTIEQTTVTAFIDVQKNALFWCVCAWGEHFSGTVLDYGCYPDQGRPYFHCLQLSKTLADVYQNMSEESAIFAALGGLTKAICEREWERDGGTVVKVGRLLVDQGYQADIVHQFCRQSPYAGLLMPAKGYGIRAGMRPMNEYQRKQGEKLGLYWRVTTAEGRSLRYVATDTNFWKSFLFSRLAVPRGSPGCLTLFGRDPQRHRLFADHLKAEYSVKTYGRGRDVIEWMPKPGNPDNHWLDCLVGCCVAASMSGIGLLAAEKSIGKPKNVSFAKMQHERRGG